MISIGDVFLKLFNSQLVYLNEPMKNHTSFKIGGPADVLLLPEKIEDIIKCIEVCKENNIQFYIMGNGTNLLVRDKGYRGVIIKISKKFNKIIKEDNNFVYAQSGVVLSKPANFFLMEELKGFEFASGIPGTLGGAIYMNAGAYGREMKNVIYSVDILNQNGNITTILNEDMKFGYRTSLAKTNNMLIIGARLKLEKGCKEEIKKEMDTLNKKRKDNQPLHLPSAGSTFKRPEGYFAGKLIIDSGLKGHCIGGAEVSNKHSGFIVNKGNATAQDVIELISYIKEKVKEKYEVELEAEVIIIGEK